MGPRGLIILLLTVGSFIGSWLGSLIDHNAFFGPWSVGFGAIGALVGIYAGYQINKNI